ncbi:hypothetical protein U2F58_03100 [Lactobacillus johnsonii]|uniref:hypothetical protein n=1 Tax=Lactobacillus johnsonii TaxID=33959 RepID=UPI00398B9101
MAKDRTEYQRNYKRKKREAKRIAAANGDKKAQEQIEKEKESNRLYMREYRKKHADKDKLFKKTKDFIEEVASKKQLILLAELINDKLKSISKL